MARKTGSDARTARRAGLLAAGCAAGVAAAQAVCAEPAGTTLARDFMLENVCLDNAGHTLMGVSPIDGDPRCVRQRDLAPGERLTYHEREVSNPRRGSESFPVQTRQLGVVGVHLYDVGVMPGQPYDQYDSKRGGGGGSVAAIFPEGLSYVATQLGHQNVKLFVGAACRAGQPVTAADVRDTWLLAPMDKLANVRLPNAVPTGSEPIAAGVVSTPSRIVDAGAPCPNQMTAGTTRWSIRPVTYQATYRAGPIKGAHVRLWSLVAERTGQSANRQDTAVAYERAYFTRELGWTRWEAWKSSRADFVGVANFGATGPGPNTRVALAQERIQQRGNCGLPGGGQADGPISQPQAPLGANGAPRSDMALVGCIEVTAITPPLNSGGDPAPTGPGTWYDSAAGEPGSPAASIFGR